MNKDEIIVEWQGRRFRLSDDVTVEKDSATGELLLAIPYDAWSCAFAEMKEVAE